MNKRLISHLCLIIVDFIIALLFICLPFVDIKYFAESSQSSKYLLFIYSTSIISLFFLLYLTISKVNVTVKRVDLLLLLLLIYISINRNYIQSYSGFSIRFQEFCGLAILYVIIRGRNIATFYFLIICMIIGAILQTIYGQLQLIGLLPSHHSLFNITGGFFNPGPYGGFLASVFPAALGLVLYKEEVPFLFKLKKPSHRKFFYIKSTIKNISIAGLAGMLLILPSTQSRSAWLAVIISSIYLLVSKYNFANTLHKYCYNAQKKILAALFLCLCVSLSFWAMYSFKKESSDGRILIWTVTSKIIKNKPWTGEGFDRFRYAYMNEQASYFKEHHNQVKAATAGDVNYGFNELLQFTAENGIPAALLVLIILSLILFTKTHYHCIAQQNDNSSESSLLRIAKAGLISIIVFSSFSYPSQILPIKLNFLLYLSIIVYCNKNIKCTHFNTKNNVISIIYRTFFFLCAIFIVLNITAKYRQIVQAFENWNIANKTYNNGLYAESLNYYQKAYPILSQSGDFLMQYGKMLSMANRHKLAVRILLQSQNYSNTSITQTAIGDSYKALGKWQQAEQAYIEAEFMVPGTLYPSYLLAKLYSHTHQTSKAVRKAREVLAKQVKIQSPAVNEIRQEMKRIINEKKQY